VVVVYLKVLLQQSTAETEESHKNLRIGKESLPNMS
jgi:hypothetical protein